MRRLVPLAAALALALAGPASAAPFSYGDARGDSVAGSPAFDILGVTYEARGTGTGRAFRATELVVTLRLAGPPSRNAATSYEVTAASSGCGDLILVFAPGAAHSATAGPGWLSGHCATTTPTLAGVTAYRRTVTTEVRGNAVVWRVPMAHTTLSTGDVLTRHVALSQPTDPVAGQVTVGAAMHFLVGTAFDSASSETAWTLRR